MKIVIMCSNIAAHDAIGNEIEIMYNLLNKSYDCYVYTSRQGRKNLSYISEKTVSEYLSDKNNLVIYHHSIYWQNGEELLKKCGSILVFRYHNVTNPEFFQNYSHLFVDICQKGREQTQRLIQQHPDAIWLADSYFNAKDLKNVSQTKLRVQPPFHIVETWDNLTPDEKVQILLKEENQLKLLSVGRIVPNKKYEFLIEVVRCYCENYDSNIHLRLVGIVHPDLLNYKDMLCQRIGRYGLEKQIEFVGEVTEKELLSYYIESDIYVCASEHEGFCVPLLESQYLGLPVLGRDFGAVGETLGKEYISITEVKEFTAAVRLLSVDKDMIKEFCRLGKENYSNRFSMNKLKESFSCTLSWILEEYTK